MSYTAAASENKIDTRLHISSAAAAAAACRLAHCRLVNAEQEIFSVSIVAHSTAPKQFSPPQRATHCW